MHELRVGQTYQKHITTADKMVILILFLTGIFFCVNASPASIKIIGGHDADIAKHPWQVSIFHGSDIFCGGSLISSQYVLTAAHCVDGKHQIHIRAGTNNSHSGGEVVGIAEIIVYPNRTKNDNDIALLKLVDEVSGKYIQPIAIPPLNESVVEGSVINIAGWGKMDEIEPIFAKHLLEVDIPIVSHEQCAKVYKDMVLPLYVSENMFCAGILGTGGKGPCYGDSGSPAVYNGTVIGIISWGFKCADGEYPAVFTQVSHYRNWIDNYISV